jgi:uncharacterized protein YndB with AHSA1/START domain
MVVDRLGTTFAALSDPTRRAMVEQLSHGPASVHRLTEPFALSQQMISKHIACLVRARIVIKTKRGRESVCTLRPEAIKTVSQWAFSYRRFWEESFDKLEVVVKQMKKAEVVMTERKANETERMVITRVFDAPRELVWKAWTDPKYVMQWWGPKGFTAPFCEIDFRVGGKFLCCMRAPDGQEGWNAGEYHEIVLHEKIVSSMYFSDSKGNKIDPAQLGIEHEAIDGLYDVTLFEDIGNGQTKLTFIGNDTMQNAIESGQLEGWKETLDKVAAVVEGLAQAK